MVLGMKEPQDYNSKNILLSIDQLTLHVLIYQKLSILSVVNITCVASQYKYFKAIDVG